MIARKVSNTQMIRALVLVNEKFNNNITWNRFDQHGSFIRFTLKCKSSKEAGHSLGWSPTKSGRPRRLISCCWHVHGEFFDALFQVCPEAVIMSRGKRITKDGGNWEDFNVGSMIQPSRASEKCQCGEQEPEHTFTYGKGEVEGGEVKIKGERQITQAHMTAECWRIQFEGTRACETCEARDTEECGGVGIRITGRNAKGYAVPLK